MKTAFRVAAIALAASALLLQGCFQSSSSSVYSRGQAQRMQTVLMGVVESVREVTIESDPSGVGTVAGGAIGGIAAGSNLGRGNGALVSGIIGAVAGGLAGSALEKQVTKSKGLEITVKLDSGELRAITQEADENFRPGDRVRLVSGGGVTRVTH